MNSSFWASKRVLLTGHTGFKGSWLALWLARMGAEVSGIALDPATDPNLFEAAGVARSLSADHRIDIVNLGPLREAVQTAQPEVVFHLAAQPLVRESYVDPLRTYAVNVMGTANLLDSIRQVGSVRAVVVITTDKCYDNREWVWPYRENDPLGGHDPYSASKAGTEIVAASYRRSFFADGPQLATARAGNVIGGGDWAADRLIPDCIRAFQVGRDVTLRYPGAVRPWQHVLDPLAGYLRLAERLCGPDGAEFAGAWNFGPDPGNDASVLAVAETVAREWGGTATVTVAKDKPDLHEAATLRLDSTKAMTGLDWRPKWPLETALQETTRWYRAQAEGQDMASATEAQIAAFEDAG